MKEAAYTLVFLLALASGHVWTWLLSGHRTTEGEVPMRSCQVKEIDRHGRVYWTPCAEWLSSETR
jgi:hypothetical protein